MGKSGPGCRYPGSPTLCVGGSLALKLHRHCRFPVTTIFRGLIPGAMMIHMAQDVMIMAIIHRTTELA